jgi:hypothetical protein
MAKKPPPKNPAESAADTAKNPRKPQFVPETLDATVIAIPLLNDLKDEQEKLKADPGLAPKIFPVIIDLNLEYPGGRAEAAKWVADNAQDLIQTLGKNQDPALQGINETKSRYSSQYVFASLEGDVIRALVKRDGQAKSEAQAAGRRLGSIYHIWPDFKIGSLTNKSISTVKADAAQTSFPAQGEDIVWAVLDSGIDASHPHFQYHGNLALKPPLAHTDFTRLGSANPADATRDAFGHGTHVAGIIAGQLKLTEDYRQKTGADTIRAYSRQRDEQGEIAYNELNIQAISGMAPKCKLLSLKVLDDNGSGLASNIIAAIGMIQELNGYGRRLVVHGVNLSVGYDFEPEWFACGQSPLCVEVNRLVRSGVVVVVAAGNTGYGVAQSEFRGVVSAGMNLPRQRRPRHHRRLHAQGHAARLRRLLLLLQRPDRRRAGQAGPGRAGREDPVLRGGQAAAGDEGKSRRLRLPGAERHQHGRAARVRRGRRLSVDPPRIHRLSREGQRSLPVHRHRLEARAILSRLWAGGFDARHSIGMNTGGCYERVARLSLF